MGNSYTKKGKQTETNEKGKWKSKKTQHKLGNDGEVILEIYDHFRSQTEFELVIERFARKEKKQLPYDVVHLMGTFCTLTMLTQFGIFTLFIFFCCFGCLCSKKKEKKNDKDLEAGELLAMDPISGIPLFRAMNCMCSLTIVAKSTTGLWKKRQQSLFINTSSTIDCLNLRNFCFQSIDKPIALQKMDFAFSDINYFYDHLVVTTPNRVTQFRNCLHFFCFLYFCTF